MSNFHIVGMVIWNSMRRIEMTDAKNSHFRMVFDSPTRSIVNETNNARTDNAQPNNNGKQWICENCFWTITRSAYNKIIISGCAFAAIEADDRPASFTNARLLRKAIKVYNKFLFLLSSMFARVKYEATTSIPYRFLKLNASKTWTSSGRRMSGLVTTFIGPYSYKCVRTERNWDICFFSKIIIKKSKTNAIGS